MEQVAFEDGNTVKVFKVGSVVRVKGQGPTMTVIGLTESKVARAVWFVESSLHTGEFPLASLDLVK